MVDIRCCGFWNFQRLHRTECVALAHLSPASIFGMRPAQVVLHIANMYVVISLNYVVSTQKFGLQRLQSFQT